MGEAPDHPVIEALSKQPPQKQALPIIAKMLSKFYVDARIDVSKLKDFSEFTAKKGDRFVPISPTGQLSYKTYELENAGKTLFNYFDIEDRSNMKTDDLISWLGSLSSSFKFTYFHAQVEKLIQSSQEAHQNCQQFVQRLLGFNENKYIAVLCKSRVKAF